jgi:hypothetical protein
VTNFAALSFTSVRDFVPPVSSRSPGCIYMPRYHFHVVDGVEMFDSLGATLEGPEAARRHAQRIAAGFSNRSAHAIRVTDDTGAVLFRIPIRPSSEQS